MVIISKSLLGQGAKWICSSYKETFELRRLYYKEKYAALNFQKHCYDILESNSNLSKN